MKIALVAAVIVAAIAVGMLIGGVLTESRESHPAHHHYLMPTHYLMP